MFLSPWTGNTENFTGLPAHLRLYAHDSTFLYNVYVSTVLFSSVLTIDVIDVL